MASDANLARTRAWVQAVYGPMMRHTRGGAPAPKAETRSPDETTTVERSEPASPAVKPTPRRGQVGVIRSPLVERAQEILVAAEKILGGAYAQIWFIRECRLQPGESIVSLIKKGRDDAIMLELQALAAERGLFGTLEPPPRKRMARRR